VIGFGYMDITIIIAIIILFLLLIYGPRLLNSAGKKIALMTDDKDTMIRQFEAEQDEKLFRLISGK
jgi:Sec-independent protein translocase protein TatA